MALSMATLVPGVSCKCASAAMCGLRTSPMVRGSMTMSFAPWRNRCFICDANTGCASVGLAPTTMMTSALATDVNACVPADSPIVLFKP